MVTYGVFIGGSQHSLLLLVVQNPWYIVTVVSYMAGNGPEAVPILFNYVLRELERAHQKFQVPQHEAHGERLLLARKFRDAIFKGGMTGGYSKVNSLASWTDRCSVKLLPGNKCPSLSARGHPRGTT
jgi:hypothetical protein